MIRIFPLNTFHMLISASCTKFTDPNAVSQLSLFSAVARERVNPMTL